jgi:hypothetical protein
MRIKKKHIKENKDLEGFKDAETKVKGVENATKELTGQLKNVGFDPKAAEKIVTNAISGVIEDGKQSKSVKPKMTKNELVESVKNMTKNVESPRKVIKTFKVKDIKNGKK